jgi:hypothetical protein
MRTCRQLSFPTHPVAGAAVGRTMALQDVLSATIGCRAKETHMRLTRQQFLVGLGGLAAGLPLGAVAHEHGRQGIPPVGAPVSGGDVSFAQSGEDLIANFVFEYLGVSTITYLDIGAYDPIHINNTFYFYQKGFRGVLVEPNVVMCEKLRAVRPRDTTLEAGIGVTAMVEADYYLMSEPSWNTFSKEEAEHMTQATGGMIKIERVVKMPLLDINDVISRHFGKAPVFLSVDAEGLHLAILKTIDYHRFRPAVICVETLVAGTRQAIPEIPAFMASQKYVPRGGSFVNTIFVDGNLIEKPI